MTKGSTVKGRVNKTDVIRTVAAELGGKEKGWTLKKTKEAVNTMLNCITASLANGEEVKIQNFGTFRLVDMKERNGVNPQTGEKMVHPAKTVARFRPANAVGELLN